MASPVTEHISGATGRPESPRSEPPVEQFMDPEAAVDDALRATQDMDLSKVEPPRGSEGLRTLGKHMFSLLEQDEASERARLGARIILMNGTTTERKLLFLHDAVDVSRQLSAEGGSVADILKEWDVPRSLVELGDAPDPVRQLMRRAERGEAVELGAFNAAVQATFAEIVPHIPVHECAGYLQAARGIGGAPPLGHIRDTKILRELEAKMSEADNLLDQAVITEAILYGAEKLQESVEDRAPVRNTRKEHAAQEMFRESEAISGRALTEIDPRLTRLAPLTPEGVFDRRALSRAIDAAGQGVAIESYAILASVDFGFPRQYEMGQTPDPEALNSMAVLAGEADTEQRKRIDECVFAAMYSGSKLDALKLADQVVHDETLSIDETSMNQVGTAVSLLIDKDPSEQARVFEELKNLGGQLDLAPALAIYSSRDELQALLDTAARGDETALRDLRGILQSPPVVDMIAHGEITFYAGGDVDIKTMFVDEGYSTSPVQAAKRAFLGDIAAAPEVIEMAEHDAGRPALARWVSLTMNANNYATYEQCDARLEELTEKWGRAIHDNPLFWKFISAEGPGYALRDQLIDVLATSDMPDAVASSMRNVFTGNHPLWLVNLEIAKWAIEGDAYHKGMVVSEIPIGLPVSRALDEQSLEMVLDGHLLQPIKDMTIEEKRLWLNVEGWDDSRVAALEQVEFGLLQESTRENTLAYRLFETIETSRSERLRIQASERNAEFAFSGANVWEPGMLTHFTQYEAARTGLTNGNLAGEMIGIQGDADNYPYNVDFVATNDEVLAKNSHRERLDALDSNYFGPIALHYRRGPGSFRQGEEFEVPFSYNGQHRLLFGGIPATEISAISSRDSALTARLKRDLVSAGLYIPIFDEEGNVAFDPHEYRDMREDGNYNRVKPEIVDNAYMREDSQAGSNEGAEMYIPGANGEPELWYVKFAEDEDHLWTERLGDGLYAGIDPGLVPETKMILIDGRLARASKIIAAAGILTDRARNRGFIVDAWLGNWDAVFSQDNLLPVDDETALRIDNGNALDFRARGAKKGTGDTPAFNEIVTELENNTNQRQLWLGMRQMYRGMTDDDIRGQLKIFAERATDELINTQVDNVRRSESDRTYLKQVLKVRRDYILTYFAELTLA